MIEDVLAEHGLAQPLRPSDRASFLAEGVPQRALTWSASGDLSIIARDRVRFGDSSFEFVRYVRDASDALNAFTVPICDEVGDVVDLLAFRPGGPAGTWLRNPIVGAENIHAPRPDLGDALDVHPDVMAWLRAGRTGVVVLETARAAETLAGVTLRAVSLDHARRLQALLTPRAPSVVVAVPDRVAA